MNRNFAYSFILLLASSHIHALNKDLFIEKVLQNAYLFESAAITLEIKEIELLGDAQQYSNWHWDLDGEILLSGRLQNKDTNYTYTHQQFKSNQLLSAELSKRFFTNGSELTLSLSGSLPKTFEEKYKNQVYYSDTTTYASLVDAEIDWELPLLRNVGGVLDQRTYDLALLELEDERLVFRQFQESTVANYLKIYFEYAILTEKANLLEAGVSQLGLLDTFVKNPVKNNALISYSERTLNKSRAQLVTLLERQLALEKKLEDVLSSDEIVSIQQVPPPSDMDIDGDVAISSVELKRIKIEQLKNQRQVQYYQNALKPELDFSIKVSKEVQKGNYSSYSVSNTSDVELSLSINYPLSGDVAVRTMLRKYKLKERQLQIKYENKLEGLKIKQQALRQQLLSYKDEIDSPNAQVGQLAGNELDFTQLSVTDTKLYIERLMNTLQLRLNYNDKLIDYHHSWVDYDKLLDRLIVDSL